MTDIQFASLLMGFLSTSVFLRVLRPLAYRFALLDEPCNRKRHSIATPLLGGVSIYLGVMVALLVGAESDTQLRSFLVAGSLMVVLGVIDDRYDINAKLRLVCQILIASLLVFGGGMQFTTLGNLLGTGEITLGWFSIPFTFLAILAAINAFNMIDGIDGLLGGAAVLSFTALSVLSGLHGAVLPMYVSMVLAVSLLPFLVSNLGLNGVKCKVFMGDSGSMFIGLAIIWVLILTTQGEYLVPVIKPVTALWLVAIPIMDIVTVMARRALKGRSPLRADRDHIHHHYMRAGFSPRHTLFVLLVLALGMQFIGVVADLLGVPDVFMLLGFLLAYFAYLLHVKWLLNRQKLLN